MPIWGIAIAVGGLLLFLALLASRFQIELTASRHGEDDYACIKISGLYGLFRWKLEVSSAKLQQGRVELEAQTGYARPRVWPFGRKRRTRRNREKSITPRLVLQYIRRARLLLRYVRGLLAWARQTTRHLHCVRLHWDITVGLGDAAATATAAGALHGGTYALLGAVGRWISLDSLPTVSVSPEYNRQAFDSRLSAVMWIRCWRVLHAGVLLLVRSRGMRGQLKRWRAMGA